MPPETSLKTFYIRTFGCQMNQHDSNRMTELLVSLGLNPVSIPQRADLIIINSCSVRAKPEHKALSEAGRYKKRRQVKGTRIILAGCVAQQKGSQLLENAPYLDAVIGPDAIGRLPEILNQIQKGKAPVLDLTEHDERNPGFVPLMTKTPRPISVPVTIMKGCNNFCSYCIVPFVRGREISRPLSEILSEVENLAAQGCREVVLLGQNVNSYRDANQTDFPALLEAIDRQAAIERIRFTTSHPKDISQKLVYTMAGLDTVCEHIHLGLQSGSDRILKLMNRGYTAEKFLEKTQWFRQEIPGVSITTDIIVGFPSESDADFQNTLFVVKEVRFDQAFSFMYSPRPQTAAYKLLDDVPQEIKAQRLAQLQSQLDQLEKESLSGLVGKSIEILVEGKSLRNQNEYQGRSRCNRVLNFTSGRKLLPGAIVPIQILEARSHTLWGKLT